MPITRMHSLSRRTVKSIISQEAHTTFECKKISSKVVEESANKTIKIAKNSTSSCNQEKYGILKNYLSFICNYEINKNLLEKSTVIRCKSVIDEKKDAIHKKVQIGMKMDSSMCSAPLLHYFTSLLDKNSEMKSLSASDRNEVLRVAHEYLDNKIDEKIIDKNLKMPTIRQARALISVICKEELEGDDKKSEAKKRLSALLLENFDMEFDIENFKDEVIGDINSVFEKYC